MQMLLSHYEKPVYNAAFRMLGNPDDAADVTQTVFLKVFENLHSYNPTYRFFSWVYRIAMNESLDQLARRHPQVPVDDDMADSAPSPQQAATASQVSDELQHSLMSLSEEHRAVIVLKYFTDADYREISDALGIPVKTVRSRLFSARQQMKARLARHGIVSS